MQEHTTFIFFHFLPHIISLLKWSYLTSFYVDVDSLSTSLSNIKTGSDNLKTLGSDLKTKFDNIKTDLENAKADCGDSDCESFIDDIKNKIDMDVDFNNLPDIQSSIDEIKDVQDKNLTQQVQTVCKEFDSEKLRMVLRYWKILNFMPLR